MILLVKVWVWHRNQNRIKKHYRHNEEQLGFYKKSTYQAQTNKKDVLVIFILQETKNSNLFDKKLYTRERKMSYEQEES